jgi:hypothetical protein
MPVIHATVKTVEVGATIVPYADVDVAAVSLR